jgi:hypothetical protein
MALRRCKVVRPPDVRRPCPPRTLWFFSGAKAPKGTAFDLKYLSAFTAVPGGIPGWRGEGRYHSVEAAFHAAKLEYADGSAGGSACVEKVAAIKAGLDMELQLVTEGSVAKCLGSKGVWTLRGLQLRVPAWDAVSSEVLETLYRSRARVDPDFMGLLRSIVDGGWNLEHFARGLHFQCTRTGEIVTRGGVAGANAARVGPMLMGLCGPRVEAEAGTGVLPRPPPE